MHRRSCPPRAMTALLLALMLGLSALASWRTTPAAAQRQERSSHPAFNPRTTLRFRHLTTNDGLPSNRVETLLQDSRGFTWVGTPEGLARYDGYRFLRYKHNPDRP